MQTYRLARDIPIEEDFDVLVAGGGPAGSAAAICAARLGAKVLLAEATGCLGGMGTSGLVSTFGPVSAQNARASDPWVTIHPTARIVCLKHLDWIDPASFSQLAPTKEETPSKNRPFSTASVKLRPVIKRVAWPVCPA